MTPQSFREMAGNLRKRAKEYPQNSLIAATLVDDATDIERLCDEWADFVHGEKKADRLVSNETVRRHIIGEKELTKTTMIGDNES